jgi:hypothetical protein
MTDSIAVARLDQSQVRRVSITRETAGLARPIRFHKDSKLCRRTLVCQRKKDTGKVCNIERQRIYANSAREMSTVPKMDYRRSLRSRKMLVVFRNHKKPALYSYAMLTTYNLVIYIRKLN